MDSSLDSWEDSTSDGWEGTQCEDVSDTPQTLDTTIVSPPGCASVLISLVVSFGLAGSFVIIYMFAKKAKLRNPPNLLIINLALSDGLLLLCYIPTLTNMVGHAGGQGCGRTGCMIHAIVSLEAAATSILTMGVIAISRYIAIVHPHRKHKLLTWNVCGISTIYVWFHSFLLIIPIFAGRGRIVWQPKRWICSIDNAYNTAYNYTYSVFTLYMTSATMAFCYCNIYMVYRRSKSRVTGAGNVQGGQKGVKGEEIRLAVQLLVVFAIFIVFWIPYFVANILLFPHGDGPIWLYGFVRISITCNSAVNVLVYLYFNRKFRAECLNSIGLAKYIGSVGSVSS